MLLNYLLIVTVVLFSFGRITGAFFTEHEVFSLRKQVSDRELQADEEQYVEETITTNLQLAKRLSDLATNNDNGSGSSVTTSQGGEEPSIEELRRTLEDNFFALRDYITSKPISRRKESKNRMLTQASLRSRERLKSMLEDNKDYLADTQKENMQISMLDATLDQLLARTAALDGRIDDSERSALLAKIYLFYELEHSRVVDQLPPAHADAKRAYDTKVSIEWLFTHYDNTRVHKDEDSDITVSPATVSVRQDSGPASEPESEPVFGHDGDEIVVIDSIPADEVVDESVDDRETLLEL